jgi:hypothetical protein
MREGEREREREREVAGAYIVRAAKHLHLSASYEPLLLQSRFVLCVSRAFFTLRGTMNATISLFADTLPRFQVALRASALPSGTPGRPGHLDVR